MISAASAMVPPTVVSAGLIERASMRGHTFTEPEMSEVALSVGQLALELDHEARRRRRPRC